MGFFFSSRKQAAAKKRIAKAGLRQAPASKQNAQVLNRLGCKVCPLDKADVCTPKMKPTITSGTHVYFLAEAPGRHEDEESGKPLTGPSGQLLRECIPDSDAWSCSFDNIVRDRPPQNRTPTWNEIECCRGHVTKSIAEAKPKLIVGLGIPALQWMLNSTDMSGMRGRVFAVNVGGHECWFMPTYHPSFILRIARNKDKPLHSSLGHCFRMDVKRAFKLIGTLPKARVDTEIEARAAIQCFDGSQGGHIGQVLGLLNDAARAPKKAVDVETSGLRPYATNARILTVAISFGSINFSFALDHPKSKWGKEDRSKILARLKSLLMDKTIKISHNVPFELEWFTLYFGKEVIQHLRWECTMMQSHFIDERRGKQARGGGEDSRRATYQSLDFLCRQYFGLAYKSLFKLNKKDMSKADLGETLIYNAVDTKYGLRLFFRQRALLEELGLLSAYEEALPRQPTVALMQHIGIGIDQKQMKACQTKLDGEIKQITAEINDLKVVKAYIKDHKEFNPAGQDVLAIFRDYLKCPEIKTVDGDKTKYSVDKNVLDQIDHPLSKLIIDLRNRSKLKSTYVDCFELGKGAVIWPDGKIHTSFNTTFAETGRTSSDEPNQQNWPKRKDSWVRKQVVPPDGHILLAFDYGQLEGCTAAMCSGDKVLIKALWEDYDLHMEWAHKTAARYPQIIGGYDQMKDKKVAKTFRALIKNKLVFPAIFGARNDSIAGYLNIPEDVIDDLMDDFWTTFDGLKQWQDRLMKRYYDDGYVESPTGRRHNYPLTRNQAINFPVQSVAADIVCDAMNDLSYMAVQQQQWHIHPVLNIHDDLTMIVPDNDRVIEESIETIYRTMLTPPYDFINVPLSVECSIGTNWFEMEEVGKFWSHKDL